MEEDPKTGRVTASFEELVYSNSVMLEAVVEVLMEKGMISREEVLEKVNLLKAQTALGRQPLQ